MLQLQCARRALAHRPTMNELNGVVSGLEKESGGRLGAVADHVCTMNILSRAFAARGQTGVEGLAPSFSSRCCCVLLVRRRSGVGWGREVGGVAESRDSSQNTHKYIFTHIVLCRPLTVLLYTVIQDSLESCPGAENSIHARVSTALGSKCKRCDLKCRKLSGVVL